MLHQCDTYEVGVQAFLVLSSHSFNSSRLACIATEMWREQVLLCAQAHTGCIS